VDGVATLDRLATLLVVAEGFLVIWLDIEGKGLTLGESVLVCTLVREVAG